MIKSIKYLLERMLLQIRAIQDNIFGKQLIKKSKYSSPTFMIIGAAKAGTTSLFQYLAQHPDISPPQKKELKYFCMSQQRYGLNKYLKNYPLKSEMKGKITFEATPTYLYLKKAPKRIVHLFPNIKFIVILRDPIERAYSHWNFYRNTLYVKTNEHLADNRLFTEAVNEELKNIYKVPWKHRYVDRGMYYSQIENTLKFISKDNLLVLDQADLKRNPLEALNRVTDFLDVSRYFNEFKAVNKEEGEAWTPKKEEAKELKSYNVTKYDSEIDPDIKEKLIKAYAVPNTKLKELMGITFSWMRENEE